MKREEFRNELLGEKCTKLVHPTGLTVYCFPKQAFSASYAVFGTNYGSIDTFIPGKDGSNEEIPNGTAHFLEHKLFECEELDAFERFAKTGANANAFTSFDNTCYLFGCTSNFEESLKILLDFVQSPYFTQETVDKEQGIIGQEIVMYKDSADWEVMFNILRALYHNHPVNIDIAGTKETISEITAELLYRCYDCFYNLNNMVLVATGNVDIDKVEAVCDEILKPSKPYTFKRQDIDEPDDIVMPYIEERLSVGTTVFEFGYKEKLTSAKRSLKDKAAMSVLLGILAGNTSPLYNEMLKDGLIGASFSYEQFTGHGYAATLFSGESEKPEEVAERIKAEVKRLKDNGIDENDFNTVLRKLYGRVVMSYDDHEEIAHDIVNTHFNGERVFEDIDVYRSLTIKDVEDILSRTMFEEYSALSVVRPIDQE